MFQMALDDCANYEPAVYGLELAMALIQYPDIDMPADPVGVLDEDS